LGDRVSLETALPPVLGKEMRQVVRSLRSLCVVCPVGVSSEDAGLFVVQTQLQKETQ
jgi:hypothetical protein